MGCCSSAPVVNLATKSTQPRPDQYPVIVPVKTEVKHHAPPASSHPQPIPVPKHSNDILDNPLINSDHPKPLEEEKENKVDNNSPLSEPELPSNIEDENKCIANDESSPFKENYTSEDEQKSEEALNNDVDELCKDGHTYQYRMDLVYFFMQFKQLEQSSPIHIPCSQCGRIFSRPGWHCQVCNSILCDSCGSNSCEKNVLSCKRNHPLVWCVDSWAFNIEINKSTKSLVTCNICHKPYQEPAYACRDCHYYSCISCSLKKGVSPPINLLVCPQNHQLSLKPGKDAIGPCGKCEKSIAGNCYKCSECDFATCQLCGIKNTLKMVRHSGLRCKKSESTMTLNDFRNMNNRSQFICQGCYKHGMKFGMFCVYCGETFCLDCAARIQQHLEEDIGKISNKGTMIEWYGLTDLASDEKFNCSCCNEGKMGIYLYDRENDKFCLECTSTFN